MTRKDDTQIMLCGEIDGLAAGGVAGCGTGWRLDCCDSAWYRQLWRFTAAVAMIDERLNFNQNGAWSIFREVNRLISQALLPSSPSHSPLLFPRHMTTSDTGMPFVYFPSAPRSSPFPPHHMPLIPLPGFTSSENSQGNRRPPHPPTTTSPLSSSYRVYPTIL